MNRIESPFPPCSFPSRPGPNDNENPAEDSVFASSSLDDLLLTVQSRLDNLALLEQQQQVSKQLQKPTVEKKKSSKKASSSTTCSSKKSHRSKPSQSKTRRGGTKRERRAAEAVPTNDDDDNNSITLVEVTPPPPPPRPTTESSCDSSVSSYDTADPPPPKPRTIDLRPHRSVDLAMAQKTDKTLRAAVRENPKNFCVRTVHGHRLVFFKLGTRIYIPESLEQVTRNYYHSKYQITPMQRMRESCWWPNMERQERRHYQWCVRLQDPKDHNSAPRLIYDSDDDAQLF